MIMTEQKMENLARGIVLKTKCPQIDFMKSAYHKDAGKAADHEEKRGKIRFLPKPVFLLFVLICLGCAVPVYYFTCKNTAFRSMEKNGYVTVLNQTQEKEGVTLKTKAVLTDGFTVYVRIQVKGLSSEKTIEEQIRTAYIEAPGTLKQNEDGADGPLHRDMVDDPVLPQISEDLAEDEMILEFPCSVSDSEPKLTYHISFAGMTEEFVVEDIPLTVPPVVERDTSDMYLVFSLPYGEGRIMHITYTGLTTRFEIEWTLSDDAFAKMKQTLANYRAEYINGGERRTDVLPCPDLYLSGDEDVSWLSDQFYLNQALDPYADLIIQQKDRKTGKTVDTLLKVEGMEQ